MMDDTVDLGELMARVRATRVRVQNILDAMYRRLLVSTSRHESRIWGPFPSSFMLTPAHAFTLATAVWCVGISN